MKGEIAHAYDERFSTAAGSIALARRITDATAMMIRGLSDQNVDRDKKDALLHVICSLYEPLSEAKNSIESLTNIFALEQSIEKVTD